MKANIFLTGISILLAILAGYLAYSIAEGRENDVICGFVSTVCFAATLAPVIGIQYESIKLGVNIRTLSVLSFFIFLVSHLCFAWFGVKMPYYIITNGILLLVYLAILYKMIGITNI